MKLLQLIISVALPSVLSLINLLQQKPNPSPVKEHLLEHLKEYLETINSLPIFTVASFLDPRYFPLAAVLGIQTSTTADALICILLPRI